MINTFSSFNSKETVVGHLKLSLYAFVLAQLLLLASPTFAQTWGGSRTSYLKWLYASKFNPRVGDELQFDTLLVKQIVPAIVAWLPDGFMKDFFKRDTSMPLDSAWIESFALLRDAALQHPTEIANASIVYTTMYLLFAEKGMYLWDNDEMIWLAETRTMSLDKFLHALHQMGFDISPFSDFREERVYVVNDPRYSFQGHTKNGVVFLNQRQLDFLKRQFGFTWDAYPTFANELFHVTSQLRYTEYDLKDPAETGSNATLLTGLTYADLQEFGSVVTSILVSDNVQQELAQFLFLRIVNNNFDISMGDDDVGYYGSTKLLTKILEELGIWEPVRALQVWHSKKSDWTIAEDKLLFEEVQKITDWLKGDVVQRAFLDMRKGAAKVYPTF